MTCRHLPARFQWADRHRTMVMLLIVLPFVFIRHVYGPWLEAQLHIRAPRAAPNGLRGHVVICRYDALAMLEKLRRVSAAEAAAKLKALAAVRSAFVFHEGSTPQRPSAAEHILDEACQSAKALNAAAGAAGPRPAAASATRPMSAQPLDLSRCALADPELFSLTPPPQRVRASAGSSRRSMRRSTGRGARPATG